MYLCASKLQLFDFVIVPFCYTVVKYGDEKIQIRFYKNLLGLNKYTSNVSAFGELEKFPLHVFLKNDC